MKASAKISKKLNDCMARSDDMKIEGWRFKLDQGYRIALGLYDNGIGGPYSPPSVSDIYSGQVYIRWADGSISSGGIKPQVMEDLDGALNEWRAARYNDQSAPDILEPMPLPANLKMKDERVADIVNKDSSCLFDILEFYNQELQKKEYAKTIGGHAEALSATTTFMNSKGMEVECEGTQMMTYANVNREFHSFYYKRSLPEKKHLNSIIDEIDRFMGHSGNKVPVKSGRMPLIIMPDVLDQLLGKYLIGSGGNMDGSSVANNQSLYGIDDFRGKKQVFHERINVVVDGLKDYSISTAPCTVEGIPSSRQYLIAGGRLITPTLNLKHAGKLGMQPTSAGSIDFEIRDKMPYSRMVKGIGYGLVVYSVLGMHTQNSKAGDYSLIVCNGLVVKEGKIEGAVDNAVIAGNLFDSLKEKRTRFAGYGKDELAMKIYGSVIGKG